MKWRLSEEELMRLPVALAAGQAEERPARGRLRVKLAELRPGERELSLEHDEVNALLLELESWQRQAEPPSE